MRAIEPLLGVTAVGFAYIGFERYRERRGLRYFGNTLQDAMPMSLNSEPIALTETSSLPACATCFPQLGFV